MTDSQSPSQFVFSPTVVNLVAQADINNSRLCNCLLVSLFKIEAEAAADIL